MRSVSAEVVQRIIDDLETKADFAVRCEAEEAFQYAANELKKALQDG